MLFTKQYGVIGLKISLNNHFLFSSEMSNDNHSNKEAFEAVLGEYRTWLDDKFRQYDQDGVVLSIVGLLGERLGIRFNKANHPVYGRDDITKKQKKAIMSASYWMDEAEVLEGMVERSVMPPEEATKYLSNLKDKIDGCLMTYSLNGKE